MAKREHKSIREVICLCEELGLEVHARHKGGHYKVYRDGHLITSLPASPGGGRWRQNLMAELRRKA